MTTPVTARIANARTALLERLPVAGLAMDGWDLEGRGCHVNPDGSVVIQCAVRVPPGLLDEPAQPGPEVTRIGAALTGLRGLLANWDLPEGLPAEIDVIIDLLTGEITP